MTVNEFRETLERLLELLRAADAKAATLKALNEFVELTEGFGDVTLKEFVKLAEVGKNPPARTPTSGRGAGARSAVDAAAVSHTVTDLYARAADSTVTEEQMQTACKQLSALKKDELVKVATGIGLEGTRSRTKPDIIAAITHRLLDRKGSAIRNQLIHRAPVPVAVGNPAGGTSLTSPVGTDDTTPP